MCGCSCCAAFIAMFWIYRRDGQELHINTTLDRSGQYVLHILWPSGREQREVFSAAERFCQRLFDVDSQLTGQNWLAPAGPILTDEAELRFLTHKRVDRRGPVKDRRRLTRRDRRAVDSAATTAHEADLLRHNDR